MPRPKKSPAKAVAPARPAVSVKLARELLEQIEAIAVEEDRPRSKVIEIACRQFVQTYRRKAAAAE
jgi:metal-responsive CopG/Arc/MetJ family transcriptional regulator